MSRRTLSRRIDKMNQDAPSHVGGDAILVAKRSRFANLEGDARARPLRAPRGDRARRDGDVHFGRAARRRRLLAHRRDQAAPPRSRRIPTSSRCSSTRRASPARIRHPNVVPTLDVVARRRRALPGDGVRARRVALDAAARRAQARRATPAARSPSTHRRRRAPRPPRRARGDRRERRAARHRPPRRLAAEHPRRRRRRGARPRLRHRQGGRALAGDARGPGLKGKLAYMAPEQLEGAKATPRRRLRAPASCSGRRSPASALFAGGQRVGHPRQGDGRDDRQAEQARRGCRPSSTPGAARPGARSGAEIRVGRGDGGGARGAIVRPASAAEVGACVGRAAGPSLAERAAPIASQMADVRRFTRQRRRDRRGRGRAHHTPRRRTPLLPPSPRTSARAIVLAGFVAIAVLGVAFASGNGAIAFPEAIAPTPVTDRPAGPAEAPATAATAAAASDAPVAPRPRLRAHAESPTIIEATPIRKPPARAYATRRARAPRAEVQPAYVVDRDDEQQYKKECLE